MVLILVNPYFTIIAVLVWVLTALTTFIAARFVFGRYSRSRRFLGMSDEFDILQIISVTGMGPFFIFWVIAAPLALSAGGIDILAGAGGSILAGFLAGWIGMKSSGQRNGTVPTNQRVDG